MDELYREVRVENECLYERFNDELGKLGKAGKVGGGSGGGGGGGGSAEGEIIAVQKWREAQEEVMKLKKELGRVKRENVVLKSMNLGRS